MNITLPPRSDGQQTPTLVATRQITIIGANGSGKTRFCNRLMTSIGQKAYRLSALRALFAVNSDQPPLPGSIDEMFERINRASPQVDYAAQTEFDKLSYVMMIDEFRSLMAAKTRRLMGESAEFPKTRLDTTVRMWQEVFPKNRILRENGKLLFSTEGHDDKYNMLRLSDGEKAVLYYLGAVQYAPDGAVVLVDDPETFIHRSMMQTLWNVIEELRPDCTFIYNTHDIDFASSRIDNQCVWVKSFDPEHVTWDYEVMASSEHLDDGLYFDLLGSRKPVLFIEGDEKHSLDAKLYPLIFPEYTIKPLGSCNKVIESVRSFNDLRSFHHLDSHGIVDRDRRDEQEVDYLRKKNILVPNVAEIENILMLEEVIRAVARMKGMKEDVVFGKVRKAVLNMFSRDLKTQALQHVRHRVKHDVERRIDMKFRNINALEEHLVDLVTEINPRGSYEAICREFHQYEQSGDYMAVLRVFNHKQMIGESNVATLCGLKNRDEYVRAVLGVLKSDTNDAQRIRIAVKRVFGLEQ